MKRFATISAAFVVAIAGICLCDHASADDTDGCTTIQDGVLWTSDGKLIPVGYDEWGYNYQSHLFNGGYCDSYRDAAWCQEWKDVDLLMKWNDAWLSNKDCDGDGLLDRHFGFDSYIGSGAWLTNHQSGTYDLVMDNGQTKKIHWTYFVKIVAVPVDAVLLNGVWYTADGEEIGPEIWGAFAIVQQIENDPGAAIHGKQYLSPHGPGLGKYSPEKVNELIDAGALDPADVADLVDSGGASE